MSGEEREMINRLTARLERAERIAKINDKYIGFVMRRLQKAERERDEARAAIPYLHMIATSVLQAEIERRLSVSGDPPCPACGGPISVNWREGKPVSYCPECGDVG